jgi:diacylglycerol kinase (ATP)
MNRPSTAHAPIDDDTQDLPALAVGTSGASPAATCDTGASSRTDMPPRSPSPSSSARSAAVAVSGRTVPLHADDAPQPPLSHHDAAEPIDPREPHEPLGPDDPLAPPPFNPYKGNRGLTRAWHAMKNSIAGFRVAIQEESAFRQELTLAAILLPIGLVVPVEPVARVLLLGSVMLVLIVELINSSIENAIDRIGLERNELSKRAKDLGSAAVMVALVLCVMTWGLILVPEFGPPLLHWLASL